MFSAVYLRAVDPDIHLCAGLDLDLDAGGIDCNLYLQFASDAAYASAASVLCYKALVHASSGNRVAFKLRVDDSQFFKPDHVRGRESKRRKKEAQKEHEARQARAREERERQREKRRAEQKKADREKAVQQAEQVCSCCALCVWS